MVTMLMVGLVLLGYTPIYSPSAGLMVQDVNSPITLSSPVRGPKIGEATADTILGLIAHGDARIETAAKNGGINKIMTVDHKCDHIFGVYARLTTIVTGE